MRLIAALSLAGLLLSPTLRAEPTAADKETARHLMKVGDQKLKAQDHKAALRAYETAHSIMGVPTTGLAVARARVALGQLIEARELLLDIARSPKEPGEPAPFTAARADAASLATDLEARIPSLIVAIQGPPSGAAVELTVDGHVVPVVGLGTTRKVNPGTYVVTASSEGHATATTKVTVAEREAKRVSLALAPGEGGKRGGGGGGDDGAEGDAFARHREGLQVGVSGGPTLLLPLDGGVLFGGSAGLLLNVGVAPKVDLRPGVVASLHGGERYAHLFIGGSLGARYNLSSRLGMWGALVAGFGTDLDGGSGFVGGPEWSPLSLRLGDRREVEIDFTQGFRFGNTPSEYHNGFSITYLFLDDPGK